jgi:hypothetical protein
MNFLDKIKRQIDDIKKESVPIKNSLARILVTTEVKEHRLEICNNCEFLFQPTMQCKKCGCFLKGKTAIAAFSCPIGKWQAINNDTKVN